MSSKELLYILLVYSACYFSVFQNTFSFLYYAVSRVFNVYVVFLCNNQLSSRKFLLLVDKLVFNYYLIDLHRNEELSSLQTCASIIVNWILNNKYWPNFIFLEFSADSRVSRPVRSWFCHSERAFLADILKYMNKCCEITLFFQILQLRKEIWTMVTTLKSRFM